MAETKAFLASLPAKFNRVLFTVAGDSIRTLSAGIFRAPRGLSTTDRFSEYRFLYLLTGTGQYRDDRGGTRDLAPGSIVHRKPGLKHTIMRRANESWVDFYFTLPTALYRELTANGFFPDNETSPVNGTMLTALGDYLRQLRRDAQPIRHLAALCSLLSTFAENGSVRAKSRMEIIVSEACRELRDAPKGEPDIPRMASKLDVGYETFRKEFKRVTGYSPYAYHVRSTIERAQRMFGEKDMSASETARQLGYPDIYSFAKQFKRYTGMTPTAFRRSLPGRP